MDNKKRLVYADMLVEKARQFEELDGDGIPCDVMAVSVTAIENAPTVDAVELVRCSSCQHSTLPAVLTQRYGEPGTLTCHNWKSPCNKRNVKSNGFCPYGERRTDGRVESVGV